MMLGNTTNYGCCACTASSEQTACNSKASYATWYGVNLSAGATESCECKCTGETGFTWTGSDCELESTIYTNCFSVQNPPGIGNTALWTPLSTNVNLIDHEWKFDNSIPASSRKH